MSHKKIIILIVAAILFAGALSAAVPLYRFYQAYRFISAPAQPPSNDPGDAKDPGVKQPEKLLPERYYTFLLYGVDTGEWVNGTHRDGAARTDVILFMQLDMKMKKATMLSIPRDTLVEIPGRPGDDKINHAHAFGGPELLVATVEQFTGIPVDYYVQINYRLFKEVVDNLGGIEFEVDRRISARGITLKPGLQHLDGDEAFALVSFRYEAMGDIGRVMRMQRFMSTVAREVIQKPTTELLPILVSGWRNVKTNLDLTEASELVLSMRGQNIYLEQTEMIPGWFYNRKGISYWNPDREKAKKVIMQVFYRQAPPRSPYKVPI